MITADLLCQIPLFEPVPQAERESIAARAADIHLQKDEWLIQEGEQPGFFFFIEGRAAVSKLVGGEERVINQYGPAWAASSRTTFASSSPDAATSARGSCRPWRSASSACRSCRRRRRLPA